MASLEVDWEEGSARWASVNDNQIDFIVSSLVEFLGEPDTIT